MKQVIQVDSAMHNRKIKYILSGTLSFSKNAITKLKQSSGIFLNGENVHVDKTVTEGDELILIFPSERSANIIPENILPDIIYEDDDIIAVNKPPSMPTHPSKNHYSGTLANAIMHYFKGEFTFRVITRLDKDTSGVVLIAKNVVTAQKLNEIMREGGIKKEYIAIVNGVPEKKDGEITVPIKRKENGGMLRCASEDGKEAKTLYSVLETKENLSYVRLNPITGRTHQIRVHLSYIGTPIYGDDMYGAPQRNERCRLHCRKIEFIHPVTKEKIVITAPMPDDM